MTNKIHFLSLNISLHLTVGGDCKDFFKLISSIKVKAVTVTRDCFELLLKVLSHITSQSLNSALHTLHAHE